MHASAASPYYKKSTRRGHGLRVDSSRFSESTSQPRPRLDAQTNGAPPPFKSRLPYVRNEKHRTLIRCFSFLARSTRLELATSRVHLSNTFVKAWTISSPWKSLSVGAPVSSLYGAPVLIHTGFPRYSHIPSDLAFTDIPESFPT